MSGKGSPGKKASPGKKKKASPEKKDGKKSKGSSKKGSPTGSKEEEKARLQQLTAELLLAQGKLATLEAEQQAKTAELKAVQTKQETESVTYSDVLKSQQREQDTLHETVRALEHRLAVAQKQIATLKSELSIVHDAAAAEEDDCDAAFKRALSSARRKDNQIAEQEAELARLREELQQAQGDLRHAFEQIETWKYRASGGRWLLQYGTVPAAGGVSLCISALDLLSQRWQPPFQEPCNGELTGHRVVACKNRLVTFGGCCGGELLGELRVFSPETMAWVQLPPSTAPAAAAPCPRMGHAMAYCDAINTLFIFGGQGEDGLLNDLWQLRMDTFEWTQLECLPSKEGLPLPCCNAALGVSSDGGQLWLFGGCKESGECQSAVWGYELYTHTWSLSPIAADSAYVEPREGHSIVCVRRWLLIAGGSCQHSSGERKLLGDTLVFDTLVGAFDRLDLNCWAGGDIKNGSSKAVVSRSRTNSAAVAGATAGQLQSLNPSNCVFQGSALLLLKPNTAGMLGELQTVHLQLPDELVKRKVAKRASLVVVERLELLDGADITPTSIQLAWLAPTKNAHRLTAYKLMVTAEDGAVREVYEGQERTFELQRLTPDREYIFSVKAIYDDASFVWSDPKAFKTLVN
ncbi:hypothetical protein N2152v2_007502 [Parachlorella kessleri]